MPLPSPTISSNPGSQADINAAFATITGFIDDTNLEVTGVISDLAAEVATRTTQGIEAAGTRAALLALLTEVQTLAPAIIARFQPMADTTAFMTALQTARVALGA